MILNPWFVGSIFLLIIWGIIFVLKPKVRREMFLVSIFTMLFGLTEPLFVPEYWNPPSLFNLAQTTGFDIESFIFAFSIGGVGGILYEVFTKVKHKKMSKYEMHKKKHKFHLLALFSPVIIFILLKIFTDMNVIYSVILSMFLGGIAAIACRYDLRKKIWIGGVSFLGLYFIFFFLFNIFYPDFILNSWNFSNISGILFFGIPVEELLFAFSFGMLWSSVYEHTFWLKLKGGK